MSRQDAVLVAAPAKLNLYLHVVGRRDDGYHLLDSLVAFADLHDTVSAAPSDRLTLATTGPFAAALAGETDNLVLRAARRLAEYLDRPARAELRLIKRIPVAAGLGGGSSDAAAALLALGRLWKAQPSPADLARLALSLGADVPVCLDRRSAHVGGIGEDVRPGPVFDDAPVVLVNPLQPLPTAAVFGRFDGPFSEPLPFSEREARECRSPAGLVAALSRRRNDLTAPAVVLVPAVGEVLDCLSATTGCLLARMSGSGGTCFGLFESRRSARAAAAAIAGTRPTWWVVATQLGADVGALDADPCDRQN